MDHLEAREILEIAAVEPGGLDRLVAGDTPEAHALAGHLAGCPECTEEFDRLRLATPIIREVIASQPPAELRERTLAFVASLGRQRDGSAGLASAGGGLPATPAPDRETRWDVPEEPVAVIPGAAVATPLREEARRPGRIPSAWLAAAAALVILTSAVTAVAVTVIRADADRQQAREIAGLAEVSSWTLRLESRSDAQRVQLADASPGGSGAGRLIFSPTTREVVVVATGLSDPGPNREYRCWVEIDGARQRLGPMYFGADLAYWVGDVDVLAVVKPGARFGISLATRSGSSAPSPTILTGNL